MLVQDRDTQCQTDEAMPIYVRPACMAGMVMQQNLHTFWITPARAGKTHLSQVPGHVRQDHPRSCGKDSNLS